MNNVYKFIPLCFACLYPSIAIAEDFSGITELYLAIFMPIICFAILLFSSTIFVYIPYFNLKYQITPKGKSCHLLHHLLCAPIVILFCICCLIAAIFLLESITDNIYLANNLLEFIKHNKPLFFCIILICIFIYLGIYKFITFKVNKNTQKVLKAFHTLIKIVDIVCCLATFGSFILFVRYEPEIAFIILNIAIITFAILIIIQNNLSKKMGEKIATQNEVMDSDRPSHSNDPNDINKPSDSDQQEESSE